MSHYSGSPEKGGIMGGSDDGRTFTFDHCLWSVDKTAEMFAGQERLYSVLGEEFLQHSLEGYNCCIFACPSESHYYADGRWTNRVREDSLDGIQSPQSPSHFDSSRHLLLSSFFVGR
jgi:hypothetical protein